MRKKPITNRRSGFCGGSVRSALRLRFEIFMDLTIPNVGESIAEVEIAEWLKAEGDAVKKDESVAVIDSEKSNSRNHRVSMCRHCRPAWNLELEIWSLEHWHSTS